MEIYGIVYETTNMINGKKYIGQTSCDRHIVGNYLGSGSLLRAAVNKYGKENFQRKVLIKCDSQDELDHYEKHFIKERCAMVSDLYYNISGGGQTPSVEFINNDKKYCRKKVNQFDFDGSLIKTWESVTNAADYFGVSKSAIAIAARNKLSSCGYIWSYDEFKFTNVKHHKRAVEQWSKNGELINIHDSISDAAKALGDIKMNQGISACCSGKLKTSRGYIWRYV